MGTSKVLLDAVYKNSSRDGFFAVKVGPQKCYEICDAAQIDKMDFLDDACFNFLLVPKLSLVFNFHFSNDNAAAGQAILDLFVNAPYQVICTFKYINSQQFFILFVSDARFHWRFIIISHKTRRF